MFFKECNTLEFVNLLQTKLLRLALEFKFFKNQITYVYGCSIIKFLGVLKSVFTKKIHVKRKKEKNLTKLTEMKKQEIRVVTRGEYIGYFL